jgi:DNA-binding SARP family transcriptional activator/nucleoid-associated protein YgaU
MAAIGHRDEERAPHGALGLLGLALGLAGCALALRLVAGPPHLPAEAPSWSAVLTTLRGSYLPPEALAYLLTTASWVVWLWIVASLALRLVVAAADALTPGAACVRGLRAVSDRVSLPVVRRAADAAVVAVVVANMVGRQPAAVAAAPVAAVAAPGPAEAATAPAGPVMAPTDRDEAAVEYEVRANDTLWRISESFYGDGAAFPRIVSANAGRRMPDGRYFTRAGVIRPGWLLRIPQATRTVQPVDEQATYEVASGDSLSGIAARRLGRMDRWPELFELNRGAARLPDGRTLTDPNLIWPGLRLRLPPVAAEPGPAPAPVAAQVDSPPEAPASPTVPTITGTEQPPAADEAPEAASSPSTALEAADAAEPAGRTEAPQTAPTAPGSAPGAGVEPAPPTSPDAPPPAAYGAAGAAAALAGGALLLARRRRVRRSLSEPPVPAPEPEGPPGDDFVEAEPARSLAHRLRGSEPEPVVLVADAARRFREEQGVRDTPVVLAYQGRGAATLVHRAGPLERARLLELAGPFGKRLGGGARAALTADHDVAWRVSGLRTGGLLSPPTEGHRPGPVLLPLGLVSGGETLYGDWGSLGHVLVAGLPGGGGEVVLTSLVAALAARHRPDALRLWTVADRRSLPPQLAGLLHHAGGVVEPDDEARVGAVLEHLREEIARRRRGEGAGGGESVSEAAEPELVLVVGELGDLPDDGTTLELVGAYGPALGVRLLAATTRGGLLGDDVLPHFASRFVLQTLDGDESVRLLGRPDASDLGAGELLVRVDGREPVHVRGFRVSSEHLDDLNRLMGGACAGPSRPAGRTDARPDPPAPDDAASGGPPDLDHDVRDGHPNDAAPEPTADDATERAMVDGETEPGPVTAGSPAADALALAGTDSADSGGPEATAGHSATPTPLVVREVRETDVDESGPVAEAQSGEDVEALEEFDESAESAPARPALLQVRCLGQFVVRSGDREVTPTGEEGGSYKAWEVLAFLASQPGGAVPRERVLASVWPDIDQERAANRLRTAMNRLRGLLARQVPGLPTDVARVERDGTCRLDTAAVWTDAQEFLALCRLGRLPPERSRPALERAVALYRGDLLTGRGARFYEWVRERDEGGVSPRERFREEYYRATQRLARLHRAEGRPALAVPLYRRLLKAEPVFEDVARELYRCYRELGDLSSLIREDRHLRQALRETLCDPDDPQDDPEQYQPEPETVELFEAIRAELEAKAPGPAGGERRGPPRRA